MEKSYIKYIRDMVGNSRIMLNATAVVIPNERNEILLQKRSDNGLWGLPGGLMELDESIEECAIREVKEETNLDVTLTKFIGVFINPFMRWREKDDAQVFGFGFVGSVTGGELRVNDQESTEVRYFDQSNLPEVHSKDNREIIEAYFNNRFNLVEGKSYHGNE